LTDGIGSCSTEIEKCTGGPLKGAFLVLLGIVLLIKNQFFHIIYFGRLLANKRRVSGEEWAHIFHAEGAMIAMACQRSVCIQMYIISKPGGDARAIFGHPLEEK